jgi:heat-inducible transcriptional repressor
MKMKNLSVSDEVKVKEKVWDVRREFDKLLHEAVLALAEETNALAVATTKDNDFYYAGVSKLLEAPEFADLKLAHNLYEMLDQDEWWMHIFERFMQTTDPFCVLMGSEWGDRELFSCGYIFSTFKVNDKIHGSIGVVGPTRLDYSFIIPKVEYLSKLISEVAQR